ncbi:VacJ family lipoprotein [Caulobacter sp. S45]|uniref:MlaA family lipoprotein n=1 Tax=Caulobacter sp. S45 TaxID=1641861 RepID=UPI00131B0350|nr:VacJ family lipoprotein [Caulobacter sp. S45]
MASIPPVRRLFLLCWFASIGLSAGPAAAKTALDEASAPDRFEKVNRVVFYANGALDFIVIRPAAMTYKRVTPRPIRTGLRNAFSNMGEPTVAINDVLQGHGKKAVRTVGRFAMNSTVGVAGLFDVAQGAGLKHHDNDFGITLAHHGVRSGPYLFLPVLGPATVRDAAGFAITIGIDPFTYLRFPQSTPVIVSRIVETALDERATEDPEIKAIMAQATDVYASIRSLYLQNREAQISGGKIDPGQLPDFDSSAPDPKSPTLNH